MALSAISVGFAARENIPQRVFIANNTFVGATRPVFVSAASTAEKITVKNNVMYRRVNIINYGVYNVASDKVGAFVCNHNLLFADQVVDERRWCGLD